MDWLESLDDRAEFVSTLVFEKGALTRRVEVRGSLDASYLLKPELEIDSLTEVF